MPLPLARCAFSRSSGGTSIVILREVGMTPQYTISDTSIEYGLRARRHGVITAPDYQERRLDIGFGDSIAGNCMRRLRCARLFDHGERRADGDKEEGHRDSREGLLRAESTFCATRDRCLPKRVLAGSPGLPQNARPRAEPRPASPFPPYALRSTVLCCKL